MNIGVIFCKPEKTDSFLEPKKLVDYENEMIAGEIKKVLEKSNHRIEIIEFNKNNVKELCRFDCVFNLCENVAGPHIPEYEIAGMLEDLGIPFTGASSQALKLCMDKAASKEIMRQNGIHTPAYEVIPLNSSASTHMAFPLFVKPLYEDGSVGIDENSVVHDQKELISQVSSIHQAFDQPALVEEFIDGRDFNISLLGNNGNLQVLPISECIYLPGFTGPRIMTYETKWVEGSNSFTQSDCIVPAELEPDLYDEVHRVVSRLYHIMGLRDYGRIDLRVKGNIPYVLDVNPNPCINPFDSGFVRSSKIAGCSFEELVLKIIDFALQDHYPEKPYEYAHP
jgi:D-alanine-D-alanine ligase